MKLQLLIRQCDSTHPIKDFPTEGPELSRCRINKKTLSHEERLSLLKQSASEQWPLKRLQQEVRSQKEAITPLNRPRKKRDTAGDYEFGAETDFNRLRHAPINEQGVALLFGILSNELGYTVQGVRAAYPTCRATATRSGKTILIGFEIKSSRFKRRRLNGQKCDLIVCWEHDSPGCSIEVLCLRDYNKQ